ncbi:MAG: orotate phosphoribosyltransferase [Alphaproteobacteria bacterium]
MSASAKMKFLGTLADSEGGAQRDWRVQRLCEIIKDRSLKKGEFELASGSTSNVFFDMKATLLHPEGINLAGDLILERLERMPVDAVGGLIIGACPLVDVLATKSYGRVTAPQTYFYVRKEPKERGTKSLIEGNLSDGTRVVIVDDVTTEGNSALRAVEAVRAHHCRVSTVITVVDREQGAAQKFADRGIELISLLKRSDFPI